MKHLLTLALLSAVPLMMTACGATPQKNAQPDSFVQPTEPKFVPPENRVMLFVGQDLPAVREYTHSMTELPPAGTTTYANMVVHPLSPYPVLGGLSRGIGETASIFSGPVEQSAKLSVKENPNSLLAVGLYIADSAANGCSTRYLDAINSGEYDSYIDEMAAFFKALNRPVLLRIGFEFDGQWNCYQPEPYKRSFIRIVSRLREIGADNVASVWQSATWPFDNTRWEDWYPGDGYVDWIGLSYFVTDKEYMEGAPPDPDLCRNSLLDFARSRAKPVIIAESSNQGYDNARLTRSVINKNDPKPVTAEVIWDRWYRVFFDYVYANLDVIKAVAYINSDWNLNPMWQCLPGVLGGQTGCRDGYWGDSRVNANSYIMAKWIEELQKPQWLHGTADLFGILGFNPQ